MQHNARKPLGSASGPQGPVLACKLAPHTEGREGLKKEAARSRSSGI